ncbi:telomeric repeat-binding factor 2 [Halogeometricum pallidum JCM 14848]|uniref:Telomeric repeat-binding factor 2 n=1 Tax=Halogeometricum pallidum JCM 14848 TaxID=1227487 RepID=M0CXS8_HALPD|nr:restriction endonuclease [Halogeometricum pallidum]ELZ27257.1 telomeric repeat-binding factor 2 [Halogeometricum pallidum JCM 14848]
MEKLPELEPEAFVSFLTDLWDERGWDTSVKQRPDETYFIVGQRGDGKRGVLYVFPTTESHVTTQHLKRFVGFCRKKGIDVAVVATQGAYAGEAREIAESKGIHLLDRETLAGTVEEGGFEHVLRTYTGGGGGGPLDRLLAVLRSHGVPVPEALPFDFEALLARLPTGGDGDGGDAEGGREESKPDSNAPDGAGAAEPDGSGADADGGGDRRDLAGALPGPLTALPRPNVVLPAALLVLVVFLLGSAVGPALGLPAIGGAGGEGDLAVSALSTAGANATAEVRWNARTAESLTVNGTAYDAPPNETFVLVRMNVSNAGSSPLSMDESSLALEVAGQRYGHQPLDGVAGFDQGGLFAPDDPREVWVVFSVPDDAESATLVLRGDESVRFVRDGAVEAEATVTSA